MDAGDSLSYHDEMAFSTADVDNDLHMSNCAEQNGAGGSATTAHRHRHSVVNGAGGWWFNSCSSSNLNGVYQSTGWYGQPTPVSWAEAGGPGGGEQVPGGAQPGAPGGGADLAGDEHVFGDGVFWFTLKETEFYSLKRVEMKLRAAD